MLEPKNIIIHDNDPAFCGGEASCGSWNVILFQDKDKKKIKIHVVGKNHEIRLSQQQCRVNSIHLRFQSIHFCRRRFTLLDTNSAIKTSSPLLFLSVHWLSVWGEGRFDLLPTVWRPDDVRGSTVKQPHGHLGKKDKAQNVLTSALHLFFKWPLEGEESKPRLDFHCGQPPSQMNYWTILMWPEGGAKNEWSILSCSTQW